MIERPSDSASNESAINRSHPTTGPQPLQALPGERTRGLPLFDANPLADASHSVRAPGGYEWWYFDAEDEAADTQIVAIYLHGFIFHPGYLRDYARYVRKPTKRLPPLPDDYACMYFCVYRGGKILTQSMTQFPADQYAAGSDAVSVRLGANTLTRDVDSLKLNIANRPWKLTGRGPQVLNDQLLKADLTFAPAWPHAPQERRFLSRAMTGADHHWVIANPMCGVTGTVTIDSTAGGAGESMAFSGRGYHDHNYGTAPLGPGLARWFWGRAIAGDRMITFHYAVPRDRSLLPESHLVTADVSGVSDVDVKPQIVFDRRVLGLPYPSKADWPGVLSLSEPRVIDASPFYLRLQYKADLNGQQTTAFCEAAYPHRLRWPVLGRMIEMSIDRHTANAARAG